MAADEELHVFWEEGMLKHETGRGVFHTGSDPGFLDVLENHPENADRVRNMVSILKRGPIAPFVSWHQGRPASVSELLSFHSSGTLLSHLYGYDIETNSIYFGLICCGQLGIFLPVFGKLVF